MTAGKEVRIGGPKRGRPLRWILSAAMLFAGAVAGWYARDFFAVNACLDAGGGWTKPGVCVGAPPR